MKVQTDVSKSYFNAAEALEDKGFKHVGYIAFNGQRRELFEKKGKQYYFVSMNHFNTTVYSVNVALVNNLKSEYGIEPL